MYFGINNKKVVFNNRRPSTLCNIEKTNELRDALKSAVNRGIRLNLACNAFIYPLDKLQYVLEDIFYCYDIGVRDIIVFDINLLLFLKDNCYFDDLRYTLSTCAPVYNSAAIHFYKSLGIERICLPRHLSLSEMENITHNHQEMEFEAIVLNARCINEDGFCCFEHGLHNYDKVSEGGGCQLKYDATAFSDNEVDEVSKRIIEKRFECLQGSFIFACAACMLPQLHNANIEYFKIVGREFTTERKIRDIRFIKSCIDYVESSDNLLEYQNIVKELYIGYYNKACDITQCYYN
jgi:putative protease